MLRRAHSLPMETVSMLKKEKEEKKQERTKETAAAARPSPSSDIVSHSGQLTTGKV